jgi:hypothetical protein
MNQTNTNALNDRYPKITRGRHEPLTQNLMAFGFECRDGWFDILNELFAKMEASDTEIVLLQVKEKFGTLRVYYHGGDDTVYGWVEAAEAKSAVTCEQCGQPGELRGTYWVYTACDECEEERTTRRTSDTPAGSA